MGARAVSLLLLGGSFAVFCLQCVDHAGIPVDWYALYKMPEIKHEHGKLFRHGVAYTYMTSNEADGWKLSSISINATKSIVGLTLQPFYNANKSNLAYIFYNDEPPGKKASIKKGHTKGAVLGDESGGIWLVHSVPHFPPVNSYTYPLTGAKFGQSFLCISLNLENLNKVG